MARHFRSPWYTLASALLLALASHQAASLSQIGSDPQSSSLPPLPRNTPNAARNEEAAFPPQNGNQALHGNYVPVQNRNGHITVVGPSHAAANATHLMSSATLSNGSQQIVLVDPAKLTVAVYHVEPNKGDVQLKSVRRIDADFSLEEFNLSEPTPSTIRKNLRNGPDR